MQLDVNEKNGDDTRRVDGGDVVDVLVLGAGGAGMMCAIHAGRRGRSVVLLDHSAKLGGKILISGGGRCNFTNMGASPANYYSQNPHFCKSALSRYEPEQVIRMVETHGIGFHEKKLGQLFCDDSAQSIVQMLKAECDEAGARFELGCRIEQVSAIESGDPASAETPRYRIVASAGVFECRSLVVATGGLSLPKLGATGLGYDIATQFGLKLTPRVPALDGFVLSDEDARAYEGLAGLSIDCVMSCNGKSFRENLLFTHAGLSGPASLQASLHWHLGDAVEVDLLPEMAGDGVFEWLMARKREGNRSVPRNLLGELLPARFVDRLCALRQVPEQPLPQVSERLLADLCRELKAWRFVPARTVGYGKAEVTRGGVDTDELSSKTMEARKAPGLHFIGEVVDVTGWLGGYNFQWAWASGWAAGQVV